MHDESVIHSAVELIDHSFVADLGPADMRIPITYALYEGNYNDTKDVEYLDFARVVVYHIYCIMRVQGLDNGSLYSVSVESSDMMTIVMKERGSVQHG